MLKILLWRKKIIMSNCHSLFSNNCCEKPSNKFSILNFFKKPILENYLLLGAPNVGKSTYFNKITWQNSPVGNIDRITVSSKNGRLRNDSSINIIDLPGVYSLNPTTNDEEVVIKTILDSNYIGCINIIGAQSFKRDMFLTIQLLEAGILNDIVINMVDELKDYIIQPFKLSRKLGVPIHLVSARKNQGVKQSINSVVQNKKNNNLFNLRYDDEIEEIISSFVATIPNLKNANKRFLSIQYLQGNYYIHNAFTQLGIKNELDNIISKYKLTLNEIGIRIKEIRNKYIDNIFNFSFQKINNSNSQLKKKQSKKNFDRWLLNPIFGTLFFLVIIFAIYYITFGEYAGGYIANQLSSGLEKLQEIISNAMPLSTNTDQWLQMFVSDGLFNGIFTVIGFLPYIIIMFGLIYVIEQTGYLARVSLLFDNLLSKFGISGRSIITLIAGTGCNIPSVMMARNSHSLKERTILILISPFISCSARLIVFMWIAEQIFTGQGDIWLFGIAFTFISCIVALFMGLVFSRTLFRENKTFLLTEISKWRWPSLTTTFKKIMFESWDFLKRVLTIVFIVNLIIFLLNYISPVSGLVLDPNAENINYKNATFLQYLSLVFQYILYPIGLGEDYRFASSLIAAAPAKEIAASVLETTFNTGDSTFYTALFGADSIISLPVATLISYIFMFAFYTPCVSTIVVLKKEGGIKNLIIHLFSAFAVSYVLCLFVYVGIGSIENIVNNPNSINGLIIVIWIMFGISIIYLLINNSYWYYLSMHNLPISLHKYRVLYNSNWVVFGVMFFAIMIGLVYCFIYS